MNFAQYTHVKCPPWLKDYQSIASPRFRNLEAPPRFFPPLKGSIIKRYGVPQTSTDFFRLYFQSPKQGDLEVWTRYRHFEEWIWIWHWDQYEGFPVIIRLLVSTVAGATASTEERLAKLENDWAEFQASMVQDGFESVVNSVETHPK